MRFRARPPLDWRSPARHHFRMPTRILGTCLLLAAAAFAPPAHAQFFPQPGAGPAPAFNPVVGLRLGWSIRDSAPSAGAQLRLALPVPIVRPAIAVGGDVLFQSGLRELQGTADLTTGLIAPLYVGGGAAVMNTVFEDELERRTEVGYSLLAGVGGGRTGVLTTSFEFRWVKVADRSVRLLMLTLGYPLRGRP